MTSSKDEMDKQKLDEAWSRLQAKLANEPAQPKWAEWTKISLKHEDQMQLQRGTDTMGLSVENVSDTPAWEGLKPAADEQKRSGALQWLQKRSKWVGIAAACLVFGAFIATPVGNEALASILNNFRMQEVTVVQENDLRYLFNQMVPDGKTREQINKFGTFTQTSGSVEGQFELSEAAKAVGYKLTVPADYKADKKRAFYVSPSNKLTLQLHVDEINLAMKRLGAQKLLPASIDGKPITLELGAAVHYSMGDEQRREWYSFTQQPVPVVTVDPSIPVAEALDAVLNFPLLPAHLKQGIQQSSVLNGGNVPLPVIAHGQSEKVPVAGTNVILNTNHSKERTYYQATWVKDNQLFEFDGGNLYKDKASVLAKIKELMES